jgi:hypothetical protein
VDREIDRPVEEAGFEGADEGTFAPGRVGRTIVAQGPDGDELDLGPERPKCLGDRRRLGDGERAATRPEAEPRRRLGERAGFRGRDRGPGS